MVIKKSFAISELENSTVNCYIAFTKLLRTLSKLRVAADHKVLEAESATRSYSREFAEICDRLAQALERLAKLLTRRA